MDKFFIGDWENQFSSLDKLEIHEGFETGKYLIIRTNAESESKSIKEGSAKIIFTSPEKAEFVCKNINRQLISGQIERLENLKSGRPRIKFHGITFVKIIYQ